MNQIDTLPRPAASLSQPSQTRWCAVGFVVLLVAAMASPLALAATQPQHAVPHPKAPQAAADMVVVTGAWVRAAVNGQSGTGGFMQLTSKQKLTLTGFSTPVAESAELHEMSMQGDVMRMRPVKALVMPAHHTVTLRPGSNHLMLMGLTKPLKVGDTVPLTLLLRTDEGKAFKQTVAVPVAMLPPASAAASVPAARVGH